MPEDRSLRVRPAAITPAATPLSRFARGEDLTAARLNAVVDRINALSQGLRHGTNSYKPIGRSGGAGIGWTMAKVISFADSNKGFNVKLLDEAGAVTGAEFRVYAYSKGPSTPNIGQQDVTTCTPPFGLNGLIRIVRGNVWTGTAWINDWWTWDTLVNMPCTA